MKFFRNIVIIFAIILIIALSFGLYKKISIQKNNQSDFITSVNFNEKLDNQKILVGSFQIVWNEYIDNILGKEIEFKNYDSELLRLLNSKKFNKDMLSNNSYYLKVGETSERLKNEIVSDVKEKFNLENIGIENINIDDANNGYTLYSLLMKEFKFKEKFDKLYDDSFKESKEKFKYFGIASYSSSKLKDNVEVLFYNNENDFAVKLYTTGSDEVILYRTTNKKLNFYEVYEDLKRQNDEYTGNKKFEKDDLLKIPYLKIDGVIEYDELCNREIVGTNGRYLSNAIQNVKFSLNEEGGSLICDSYIVDTYLSEILEPRYFYFDEDFYLFLIEENEEYPYFYLKVDDDEFLDKVEENIVDEKINEEVKKFFEDIINDEEFYNLFNKYSGGPAEDYYKDVLNELNENPRKCIFTKSGEDFLKICIKILDEVQTLSKSEKKIIIEKLKNVDINILYDSQLKRDIQEKIKATF